MDMRRWQAHHRCVAIRRTWEKIVVWTKGVIPNGPRPLGGPVLGNHVFPAQLYGLDPRKMFLVACQKNLIPLRRQNMGLVGYLKHGGWKIHVSATLASAEAVGMAVLPKLLALKVWHKFATTACLTQMENEPGQAGKYITIYPNPDDEDALDGWKSVLAAVKKALLTANLDQPRITDHREVFVDPSQSLLPKGISMRWDDNFNG